MTCKMHGALIASLGLLALCFAADEAFARSGAAPVAAAPAAPAHARGPVVRSAAPFLRHHRGNRIGGAYWPVVGGYYDPSIGGSAPVEFAQPESRDARYTYTYDVPWDWAHRYPPAVIPSDRAYVTECPQQTVKVAGKGGREQTVNIMRCY